LDVVAELERARVDGAVDGAGEHDDELHQRWPAIGLAARRTWRYEGAQTSAVAGVRAALATALAADRGAAGQGEVVR
jgi:hypothetical protein